MINEIMKYLSAYDPEVGQAIEKEAARQRRNIELIASENIVSEQVLVAAASVLTNKYAEGYPAKRYYGGCECVDIVEDIAINRAKELFGAAYANVQPHSGANANTAVYLAYLQPGDTVLGMDLSHGGHLTHGSPVNISGKYFNFVAYGLDEETQMINYDTVLELAKKHKPKMIVAGASAYSRKIDFEKFGEIAKEVGALLFVDMAHIAGLVAAGLHQNPVPYADIVTTTTHKTLRGPRGGLILSRDPEVGVKINKAVFPGLQGGPLMHIIGAKAMCFGEALKPDFKEYQKQVIKNAGALADALVSHGFQLISGGTDNHLMLVDLANMNITGQDMEHRLDDVYITVNKNSVPYSKEKAAVAGGMRLGTPAVTSRGMEEDEMKAIAGLIKMAATDFDAKADEIRSAVCEICDKHPIY